eukprot:6194927-Pleurochrysis_carterae.AAC.2
MSTCREESQGDTFSAGRPGCSPSIARASDERTPLVGVRGGSQGGSHPHWQLNHEQSRSVDSRRVDRCDARPFEGGTFYKESQPRSSVVRRNKSLSSSLCITDKDSRSKLDFLESRLRTALSCAALPSNLQAYCQELPRSKFTSGDLVRRTRIGYSVYDAASHGQGAGAGAGTKRTYGAALGRGARRWRRPCANGESKA